MAAYDSFGLPPGLSSSQELRSACLSSSSLAILRLTDSVIHMNDDTVCLYQRGLRNGAVRDRRYMTSYYFDPFGTTYLLCHTHVILA